MRGATTGTHSKIRKRSGLMIEKLKALLSDAEKRRELLLYVFFGVLTTAVNWGTYTLLTVCLGLERLDIYSQEYRLLATVSSAAGWIISVLFAYMTNRRFVFQSKKTLKDGAFKEFGLFVSARVMSLLLFDLALFYLLLAVLPDFSFVLTRDQWIKLMMNALVVVFNYAASKWVIFGRKKDGTGK